MEQEKISLLLDIIYCMILAEKGMRTDHDKYQKIMYELAEAAKIIRDSSLFKPKEESEIMRAKLKLEELKPALRQFA